MKLNDGYYDEEHGSGSKLTYVYMALIMSVVVLGVTALVFWANSGSSRLNGKGYAAAVAQRDAQTAQANKVHAAEAEQSAIKESKLTSDQLDIWTLPEVERKKNSSKPNRNNGTVINQTTGETVTDGSADKSGSADKVTTADELLQGKTSVYNMTDKENIKDGKSDSDKQSGGTDDKDEDKKDDEDKDEDKRIQVVHSDGTKEWVDVSKDIAKNKYDYSKLTFQSPVMNYSVDGKVVSKCGADISANQGEVDFSKLKKAGVDYVMIRVGARGYSSGNIVLDKNYKDNLKAAQKAGLGIGVYFCSQAVSKSEAREEADELIDAIDSYDVKYPVVFVMENVEKDMARIEALDTDERTSIAKSFMDRIESAGYKPMIYGDKEWLLTMVDMERLQDYDVWYAQDSKQPDYPYEFNMWQYDSDAKIKGVDGNVALSISFVDYGRQ